jgi:hypothetical protein
MGVKNRDRENSRPQGGLFAALIGGPVERSYLRHLDLNALTDAERIAVRRQAVIGWLQTLLLVVVLIQTAFASVLRALPPDIRTSLAFLHRIEWAAYLGVLLIMAQVSAGWNSRIVLTNRYFLLAWRFSRPRLLRGQQTRLIQALYILIGTLLVGAIVWVRIRGFIFQSTR